MMKKHLFLATMAVVVLASCAKEKVEIINDEVLISKEFFIVATVSDDATKGTLDGTGAFTWSEGDKIGMLVDDTVTALTASSIDGDDATFTATGTTWGTAAFYPWNAATEITSTKVTYTLPESYAWKADEVFTPMIADLRLESNPTTVKFKLAGAGIRVSLNDVPANANKVALTVDGYDITGTFDLNLDDAGTAGIVASAGTHSTVAFTFPKANADRDMTFTFPIPTLPAGAEITIDLYSGTEIIWTKASTSALPAVSRGQIIVTPALAVTSALHITRLWQWLPSDNWLTTLGIDANRDRSAAMDQDYVYVARATATPLIKAIKISDQSVKNVNVTGMADGCFPASCVRTIYNPSTDKYILLASSLAFDNGGANDMHLKVYAWVDGIDNAPSCIHDEVVGASRRFGDTFTVCGDWVKGYLWFRNNNSGEDSATQTGRLNIVNGVITNASMDGWKHGYNGSRGLGSFYQYDVDGIKALLVTSDGTHIGMMFTVGTQGGAEWSDGKDYSYYSYIFGVTPFVYNAHKYIAYVKMGKKTGNADNIARSRLKIIEDLGTDAQFMQTLVNDKVVYEVPIHNSNIAAVTDTEYDAKPDGNYAEWKVCDCSVVKNGSDVYIMAHHTAVGISVFKMTVE